MKSCLKIFTLSVLTATTFSAQSAMADCRDAYKYAYDSIDQKSTTVIQMSGSVFALAGTFGFIFVGPQPALVTSGVGASASAVAYTVEQVAQAKLIKVIRLIDQAKLGVGLDLNEFASDLKVDQKVAAALVLQLNSNGALCQSSSGFLSLSQIKDLALTLPRNDK